MNVSNQTVDLEMPHGYSMPAASPIFTPPPYHYERNRQVTILFKTTADVVGRFVPAPLQPNPQQLIALYYSALFMTKPIEMPYREVGLFVPVSYKGIPGLFFVFMYLDSVPGVVGGREIWGFPKKEAAISFVEQDGKVSTEVTRMGCPIIRATFTVQEKVETIPPSPFRAFYNLKVIPSIKRNARPDVLQLTSTPVVRESKEMHSGTGVLELRNSPSDKLGEIPVQAIANSQFEIYDMILDCGEVALDYLKQ